MNVKQRLQLFGLTLSVFILNTSEFMPIGLLTDISGSFGINEAAVGIMVTAYAWAVMLLSLPLMIAVSRVDFKRLLLGVLLVFSIGQLISAFSPSFPILVLARILVAGAHAVFWSIASVMATRLVDTKHAPLAIGMIATGTSIAMIFGLPLGRAIGLAVGWRMTFFLVCAISLATLLFLAAILPSLPAGEPFTLAKLPTLLKNKLLIAIYVVAVLFATSYYTGYSYIEPFLQQVAGMDPNLITVVLTLFGFAGLLGSALFSRIYDFHRLPFLSISIAGVAVSLLVLKFAAHNIFATGFIFALWGCCDTAFYAAFQAEIIKSVKSDESPVAMSMFSGLFNLGIGAGSSLGGLVVTNVGVSAVGYVGGAVGLLCWLFSITVLFCLIRKA